MTEDFCIIKQRLFYILFYFVFQSTFLKLGIQSVDHETRLNFTNSALVMGHLGWKIANF